MRVADYKKMGFNERKEILKRFGDFAYDQLSRENGKKSVYRVFSFLVEVNYDFDSKIRYIRVIDKRLEGQYCPIEKIRIHLN